jgi:hypothetical protein
MSQPDSSSKPLLTYLNLSDEYERKTRFIPALLTISAFLPVAIALSLPYQAWLASLFAGVGMAAAFAVAISHVASAMGNRLQRQLWPRWPYDAPTNQWLHPADTSRSSQQKQLWYAAIHRLTELRIAELSDDDPQVDAIINDAVVQVRTRLWKSEHADRLRVHNADFGYARNLTGLRSIWIFGLVVSLVVCSVKAYRGELHIAWTVACTMLLLPAVAFAYLVLPNYVRQKADQYAESFFDSMAKLDTAQRSAG